VLTGARLLHELIAGVDRDHPAIRTPGAPPLSFGAFDRQVRSVAGWVAARTRPGDRVAVVADNSAAYAVLYYAVPRAARVLTLINQRLSAAEQAAQLTAVSPRILFGDNRYLEALPDVGTDHTVRLDTGDWTPVLSDPAADGAGTPQPHPDDPAWLLFTSGSTGVPKPVVHSHRSLLAAVGGTVAGRTIEPGGVYLLPFPMCHVAGYNLLVHHAVGNTVVLTAQFRAEQFADLVDEHGVTACSLAPTMLHALLAHLEQAGRTLPTLRSIAYGSAAIPADLIARALDRLDVDFHQGYGMTETGGNITFLGPADHRAGITDPALLGSAGYPHAGVQIRIVDDTDTPVAAGATGEIVVRGDQVTPDVAGWLRTGDVGRVDADGRLWVVDRRKDIIITGGENVSSREVEDALGAHPDVDAVAVVGVPDPYWGEAICAVVVPVAGRHPDPEALVAWVRTRIAAFKRPRHVLFVDALPLTSNGKVAKEAVRRLARDALMDQALGE
jgi:acyl-CoA synthetase (AMP-forming)/AMP-acid ligase II